MSFLAPYMLWGTLAASIPIILHFFYRSRYRNVPWAAMKFLLSSIEQTSRRLRFQELLLLILRVCLLALLALALARPTFRAEGRSGTGDAVDAVFLIDTSMSMDARSGVAPLTKDTYANSLRTFSKEGSVTCVDRAKAAALSVLASLPPHSTVRVITVGERASVAGPDIPSHLDQAKSLIENLNTTSLGTDFLPAVREGTRLLLAGSAPNKELYLFSDMQRRGWQTQTAALSAAFEELRPKARIHLVHCNPSTGSNLSLVALTPQSTLRSGERADFAALVRNTGKAIVRNVNVTLEIAGSKNSKDTQVLVEIAPGETKAVVLSVLLEKSGRTVLSASLKGDDLPGDNRLDQVIQVADRIGILVVDGSPSPSDPKKWASFYLQHALNPLGEDSMPLTILGVDRVSPRDLGGKELCILANVRLDSGIKGDGAGVGLGDEFVRALATFVQQGRGLVVFAGDKVEPDAYNRILFEQLRLLPYRIAKVDKTTEDKPWFLDRGSADIAPYNRFRNEQVYEAIDKVEVRKALALDVPKEKTSPEGLELAAESRVLLRYNNGGAAVAARRRTGQGEVVLFTTSMNDSTWSYWFTSPVAFVPFVQVTLNHLLDAKPGQFNRIAGESIAWPIPREEAGEAFDVIVPSGERLRQGAPTGAEGRYLLEIGELAHAGIYHVVRSGTEPTNETPVFAVTPDLRETEDLETLAPAAIDGQLGFSPVHLMAAEDGSVFSGAERLDHEWTMWLLTLLLILVVCEMLLAWHCGRAY
jgi:hypothetical protein